MKLLNIKSVILYDNYQNVVGFVEFKNLEANSSIKVKHNLDVKELILSINAGTENHVFNMSDKNFAAGINREINLDQEVAVVLLQKEANNLTTVASGIINPSQNPPEHVHDGLIAVGALKSILNDTAKSPIDRHPSHKTKAAREVDEILRAVCSIDNRGKGMCESCPYREFFYGENIDENVLKHQVITAPCNNAYLMD